MVVLASVLLAAAIAQSAPPSRPAQPARAQRNLASLVQDDDYPREALARGEQGIVYFTLSVLANGRVGACRVTLSSGSPSIDARTCEIMVRHARFRPARDAQGNAVPDTVETRLGWWLAPGTRF